MKIEMILQSDSTWCQSRSRAMQWTQTTIFNTVNTETRNVLVLCKVIIITRWKSEFMCDAICCESCTSYTDTGTFAPNCAWGINQATKGLNDGNKCIFSHKCNKLKRNYWMVSISYTMIMLSVDTFMVIIDSIVIYLQQWILCHL